VSSESVDPFDVEIPDSGIKAVQARGTDDCAIVVNALEAAKAETDATTDADSIVEVCRAYTGWEPSDGPGGGR